MYKVFVNSKEIAFVSKAKAARLSDKYSPIELDLPVNIIKKVKKMPSQSRVYLSLESPKSYWTEFLHSFKNIEAGGGIVQNNDGKVLFIYRKKKWDLPKGKLKKKELPRIGAIREVEEECGINGVEIVEKLCDTFHSYSIKDEIVIKKTHWYLMKYEGDETPVPEIEEDIEIAKWCNPSKLKKKLTESYPSIKAVVKKYRKSLLVHSS